MISRLCGNDKTKDFSSKAFDSNGRLLNYLLALIIFVGYWAAPDYSKHTLALQNDPLQELWIDMRIGPPIIPIFNQSARDVDIARVDHPSQAGQLSQINNGRKLVIFKSIAEAEQFLPDLANDIDILGYNLEHGQTTPEVEKADPLASVQEMRAIADRYGLDLAFGPDHDFALSHGVDVAPYVDIFVLQIQRQQTNPAVVKAFVEPIAPQLRRANPDLQISVQVRTEGDVAALHELLLDLEPQLDGISILTSPDTVDTAEDLMVSLRPNSTQSLRSSESSTNYFIVAIILLLIIVGFYFYRQRQSNES